MTPTDDDRSEAMTALFTLARNAHVNVDRDDPFDYWYRLGQRNAYATALGLVIGDRDQVDPVVITDAVTTALDDGATEPDAVRAAVTAATAGFRASRVTPRWVGSAEFEGRYGSASAVDHDLGLRVGPRRDQRVSVRTTGGSATGVLFVHDTTWDEYAVLDEAMTVDLARARADRVRRLAGPTGPTQDDLPAAFWPPAVPPRNASRAPSPR